ncbi:flagella synthesis protein FlgN [Tamilnaduibacter salinus]|uniref:Flagella synthesis protein FlgN n=1 Tax=Tamilnaduibacter salinus TaxID=1484056 RepID=A0A2A2I1Y5_9GAMM|nr:flagellar protein FlgN [Tamilnaduibacter salinus]PAV25145.1 flagellar biosynthesis protein FlgN [Tamilnaduibacter salinus]PVY78053.1 flagella synthesis protein FlgN [Tamilnaduibacter salinus]
MAAVDDLKKLLQQDVQQLDQLSALLEKERDALKAGQARELEALTKHKDQLLSGVRERAKQKIHTLVAMGYDPKQGQPSRFIRSAGMADLSQLWQEADQRLRHCQERNGVNGRIIGHLQQRLGRLTDIIRGASDQAKLYGERGQSTSVSHTNVLASA